MAEVRSSQREAENGEYNKMHSLVERNLHNDLVYH